MRFYTPVRWRSGLHRKSFISSVCSAELCFLTSGSRSASGRSPANTSVSPLRSPAHHTLLVHLSCWRPPCVLLGSVDIKHKSGLIFLICDWWMIQLGHWAPAKKIQDLLCECCWISVWLESWQVTVTGSERRCEGWNMTWKSNHNHHVTRKMCWPANVTGIL